MFHRKSWHNLLEDFESFKKLTEIEVVCILSIEKWNINLAKLHLEAVFWHLTERNLLERHLYGDWSDTFRDDNDPRDIHHEHICPDHICSKWYLPEMSLRVDVTPRKCHSGQKPPGKWFPGKHHRTVFNCSSSKTYWETF
jgi:hypothetical protein